MNKGPETWIVSYRGLKYIHIYIIITAIIYSQDSQDSRVYIRLLPPSSMPRQTASIPRKGLAGEAHDMWITHQIIIFIVEPMSTSSRSGGTSRGISQLLCLRMQAELNLHMPPDLAKRSSKSCGVGGVGVTACVQECTDSGVRDFTASCRWTWT